MSRFVIGIDLGTTNSALAFAELSVEGGGAPQTFAVPQVVGPGEIAPRATLPSFLLLPTEHEVAPAAMQLPWSGPMRYAVGAMARDRGSELPHRLVSSAKSWLCNGAADRNAAILPWRGTERLSDEDQGERVSPVNASAPASSSAAIKLKSVVPPPTSQTSTRSPGRSSFRHASPLASIHA